MTKESLLEIQAGMTERPFEDKKTFLRGVHKKILELHSHHSGGNVTVLNQGLDFEGILGKIEAFTDKDLMVGPFETPLGVVSKVTNYDDGLLRIRQVPLKLRLSFNVSSKDQLDYILGHTPEIGLDLESYYLRYLNEHYLERRVIGCLERYGSATVSGTTLVRPGKYDLGHQYGPPVILPYNLPKLREGVRLTMIEKDLESPANF